MLDLWKEGDMEINATQSVSQHHTGELQRTNPDLTVQVKKENQKNLTLYVPENLHIDELLKENPPKFKYQRDFFIYLVHLINDIPSRSKESYVDYVPLNSTLLQRRNRQYREHLDYLIEVGVFNENAQYIVGSKSRSFCLTNKYQTMVKPIVITKHTLIKSILKYINVDTMENDKGNYIKNNRSLEYLSSWFNDKLTIDFEEAKQYLLDLYEKEKKEELNIWNGKNIKAMARFNSRYIVVNKLHKGQFLHTIDNTAGRFHTVLTQIKGDLRQFIRFNGQKLIAVDIVNSQPYLSCVLFDKQKFIDNKLFSKMQMYNKGYLTDNIKSLRPFLKTKIENATQSKSVNDFTNIVKSGKLYERFSELLLDNGLIEDNGNNRKQAKEIIFSSIFSPNQSIAYNNAMVIFKKHFPDVYEIYRAIKQGEHRTLACILQNLEAELILHTACKIISEQRPDIPLFTLHDSIITTEGNEDFVYKVLYDVLLNAIGIPPTLKYEKWNIAA